MQNYSSRTRVLMLTTQLGYGGSETSFLRVAHYLARYCHVTITLFTRYYDSSGYTNAQQDINIPIVLLDETSNTKNDTSQVARIRRWSLRLRRLKALKQRHDVTISFLSGPNLLNVAAGRRFPSVVSERGPKRWDVVMGTGSRVLWTRFLDPLIHRSASGVVAASEGLAQEIAGAAGAAARPKIRAIEGTINSNILLRDSDSPIEKELMDLTRAPVVVACGRLSKEKGFSFLISAFALTKQRVPEAALLIIGDGPDLVDLERLCKKLDLKTTRHIERIDEVDVVFLGHREQPIRYFRIGKVFALPSLFEGLPNVLIEAVASGIPILAADCPHGSRSILANMAELDHEIADGALPMALAHGTLMPRVNLPGSEEVWAERLVAALRTQQSRATLTQRREAIARFDLENTGKSWLRLIEELTGKPVLAADEPAAVGPLI